MAKKEKARQYAPTTIRRLDTSSGNQCAFPGCKKRLIAEDHKTIVSKICHIAAASRNGPRFDASMSDDERRSYDNLILLCDEHHVMIDNIDNESIYTTEILKNWKRDHERKNFQQIFDKNLLSVYPLTLNKVINAIADQMDEILDLPLIGSAPNTETKILYNNVVRYKSFIRDFAPYQHKLNSIYQQIEKEGSTKKLLVLNNIKLIYIKVKKQYKTINDVRKNADTIIDEVIELLWDNINNATNKINDIDRETIDFCLMIIIVDSFMRCKILEEPPRKNAN